MLSVVASRPAISLEDITKEPHHIKILIIHIPLPLQIESLPAFRSLMKLDLSNNNLASFPYIGHLSRLKFIFLHQNRLTVNCLVGAFEREDAASALAQNVAWVTYWGNREGGLARHYVANRTSAIAFDRNLIAAEERFSSINVYSEKLNMFSPLSDVSDILVSSTHHYKNKSEEELISQLWVSLDALRKRFQQLNPVIKIQKFWRGWIYREHLYRLTIKEKQRFELKSNAFYEWKTLALRQAKLNRILKKYKINEGSITKKLSIQKRMIELARMAKARVLHRKQEKKGEIQLFLMLKSNLALIKDFYTYLKISESTALYICRRDWRLFEKYIIPFAKRFNSSQIKIIENSSHLMCKEYQFNCSKYKQIIKLVQLNTRSIFLKRNYIQDQKSYKKPVLFEKMAKLASKIHFNRQDFYKMNKLSQKLDMSQQQKLKQLIVVQGNAQLLRDISRGIYFFNTRRMIPQGLTSERINFFSQAHIETIAAAVTIQKIWRGFTFRKRQMKKLKKLLLETRAAISIQRWFRRLPYAHKKCFQRIILNKLSLIKGKTLLVSLDEYFKFINGPFPPVKFNEQCLKICLKKQNGGCCLIWPQNLSNQYVKCDRTPFNSQFLKKVLCSDQKQLDLNFFIKNNEKYEQCDRDFLFHWQLQNSIINHEDKKYLKLSFRNELDLKFRLFALCLLSYDFRSQSMINVMDGEVKLKGIKKQTCLSSLNHSLFISDQNVTRIATLTEPIRNSEIVKVYRITCKFYITLQTLKSIKVQEKFYFFLFQSEDNHVFQQKSFQKEQQLSKEGLKLILQQQKRKEEQKESVRTFKTYRGENVVIRKRSIKRCRRIRIKSMDSEGSFLMGNERLESSINVSKHVGTMRSEQVNQHSMVLPTKKSFKASQHASVRCKTEKKEQNQSLIKSSIPLNVRLGDLQKLTKKWSCQKDSNRFSDYQPKNQYSLSNIHPEEGNSVIVNKKSSLFQTKKREKRHIESKNRYFAGQFRENGLNSNKLLRQYSSKQKYL